MRASVPGSDASRAFRTRWRSARSSSPGSTSTGSDSALGATLSRRPSPASFASAGTSAAIVRFRSTASPLGIPFLRCVRKSRTPSSTRVPASRASPTSAASSPLVDSDSSKSARYPRWISSTARSSSARSPARSAAPSRGGSLRSSVFDLARPSGVSVGADAPLRRSPVVTRVSETGASGARGGGASLAEESERALRTWCARAAARSLSCAVQLLGLRPSSKVTRPARSPSSLTGRTSTERIPSEAAHSSRTGAVPVGRWVSSTATAVTRSRASRKPAASS